MDNQPRPPNVVDFGSKAVPVQDKGLEMRKNPNAPLRLLSFDGGGVRGLSSLIILDTLMRALVKEEKRLRIRADDDNRPIRPCDVFDLIGGTSTGGIIAVLLGRLRLTCEECITIYCDLAQQIFQRDRCVRFAGLKIPTGATRFSGAVLEQTIKDVLKKQGFDENELMWDASIFEELTPDSSRHNTIWSEPSRFRESPIDMRKGPQSSTEPNTSIDTAVSVEADANLNTTQELSATVTNSSVKSASGPKRKPTFHILPRHSVHKKTDRSGCRVFVVSVSKHALGLPRLLSTFDPNDKTTKIWEALRATSAAPTFFEEMVMGNPRTAFLDGGVGFNVCFPRLTPTKVCTC